MRVLIVGAGRAGLSVGVHLSQSGHVVTIVDRDARVTQRAAEEYGLVALTGDATEAALLVQAEVARHDVLVAMLNRDADNLAVALLARSLGLRRVMVRMRDRDYRSVYLAAGVDRLLSETEVIIGGLATAIEHESVRHAMLLGNGESVAFEVALPETSPITGKTISEIASAPEFPQSCVFAGIYHADGSIEGARGSAVIHGGMTVLLVARRSELAATLDHLIGEEN
jgi:trk system potassium uptake protein